MSESIRPLVYQFKVTKEATLTPFIFSISSVITINLDPSKSYDTIKIYSSGCKFISPKLLVTLQYPSIPFIISSGWYSFIILTPLGVLIGTFNSMVLPYSIIIIILFSFIVLPSSSVPTGSFILTNSQVKISLYLG